MNKNIIISVLILITLCCCGVIATLTGILVFSNSTITADAQSVLQEEPVIVENQPPRPLDTPIPSKPIITGNDDSTNLPADMVSQLDEIQAQVSQLRGLQSNQPVDRGMLNQEQLQEKVESEFFKEYTNEEAQRDVTVLSILGLLPPDFDLIGLYKELYAEQIAGFYDSETKEMYVVQDGSFSGIERMTYAHEYTHTLQDQNYDLENGLKLNEEYCDQHSEYCSAVSALVEGDATFTEQAWLLGNATQEDKQDITGFYSDYSSPVFDSAPEFLQMDFLFPYQAGLEFVYSLNDRGGYGLVDQAFRDLPVSTEQILHPDKYPSEKPDPVAIPDLTGSLPAGWKNIEVDSLGEWSTILMLTYGREKEYRLPDTLGRKAAAGWGGDKYAVFTDQNSEDTFLILKTHWDTDNDANEFFNAFRQYGSNRWGNSASDQNGLLRWDTQKPAESAVLIRSGSDTILLISSSLPVMNSVLRTIPEAEGIIK